MSIFSLASLSVHVLCLLMVCCVFDLFFSTPHSELMNEQQAAGDMLRNAQNSDRRFVGVGAASGV